MNQMQRSGEIIREVLQQLDQKIADPEYFHSLIDEMREMLHYMEDTMTRKGQDYSGNRKHHFANFEVNASLNGLTEDQVFLALIGVKFSRLANLLNPSEILVHMVDDVPVEAARPKVNFESIEDSWLDAANYIVLLIAYKHMLREEGLE